MVQVLSAQILDSKLSSWTLIIKGIEPSLLYYLTLTNGRKMGIDTFYNSTFKFLIPNRYLFVQTLRIWNILEYSKKIVSSFSFSIEGCLHGSMRFLQ